MKLLSKHLKINKLYFFLIFIFNFIQVIDFTFLYNTGMTTPKRQKGGKSLKRRNSGKIRRKITRNCHKKADLRLFEAPSRPQKGGNPPKGRRLSCLINIERRLTLVLTYAGPAGAAVTSAVPRWPSWGHSSGLSGKLTSGVALPVELPPMPSLEPEGDVGLDALRS